MAETVSIPMSTTFFGSLFDRLLKRNMRQISTMNGFWLPVSEFHRYEQYDWIDGVPDQDITKLSRAVNLTKKRGCALDIGANVGTTATFLASHFETVHAFEPAPDIFEALRRNISNYPGAVAHNCAIGSKPGKSKLTLYTSHGQLSHLECSNTVSKECIMIGPIPVRTIDGLNLPDVDFIKIDVEGFEGPVIQGAEKTIRRCRPVILFEQAGNDEKMFGFPRNQASILLESFGMVAHPDPSARFRNDRVFYFPD